MDVFNHEHLFVGAQSVGMARACLEQAVEYSLTRKAWGKPIAEFQAVSHKIADMWTQLLAARTLLYYAGRLTDAGVDAVKEMAAAKYFAGEMVNKVCYDAIEIFGGLGYMMECPVQRYYRDARVQTIGGGTSEIQKNIISRRLLKRKGEG
mgnify:CR=1 FL=1